MSEILNETVDPYMLEKYEKIYHNSLNKNNITVKVQFEYAWCLVRSKYPADIYKGLFLLEELLKNDENCERHRDYIYYLAVGNARLQEYHKAFDYCERFLRIEPENSQVLQLVSLIRKKQSKGMVDKVIMGFFGIAIGTMLALHLRKSLSNIL